MCLEVGRYDGHASTSLHPTQKMRAGEVGFFDVGHQSPRSPESSLDRKEGKDNPERTPDYRHHQIFGIMKLTIHLYHATVLVREDL